MHATSVVEELTSVIPDMKRVLQRATSFNEKEDEKELLPTMEPFGNDPDPEKSFDPVQVVMLVARTIMVAFLLVLDLVSYLGEEHGASKESLAAHAGGFVVGVFATAALRAASAASARITKVPSPENLSGASKSF